MFKATILAMLMVLSSSFRHLSHTPSRSPLPLVSLFATPPSSITGLEETESSEIQDSAASPATITAVERCYECWNRGDMTRAAACFASDFTYDDGQFLGKIGGDRAELAARLSLGKAILPPKSVIVLDSLAVCPATGNIGTRWHMERDTGGTIPLTRGCSFYTVDSSSGLIQTGFKVSEMVLKPSKDFANALVSSASKLLESSPPSSYQSNAEKELPSSIIETSYRAWNERDMDAALDCFVEDCFYETEDPVFVDTFEGKESLRRHLETNAKALPRACQIILDDVAIDDSRGTAGVKWHLEANGVSLPNLRGCSMVTMDSDTGLLRSCFDVTEAPVKVLPGVAKALASTVPPALFRTFLGME